MGLGSVIFPVGLLMAGWAAERRVHWIVVDIVRRWNDWLNRFSYLVLSLRATHSLEQVLS